MSVILSCSRHHGGHTTRLLRAPARDRRARRVALCALVDAGLRLRLTLGQDESPRAWLEGAPASRRRPAGPSPCSPPDGSCPHHDRSRLRARIATVPPTDVGHRSTVSQRRRDRSVAETTTCRAERIRRGRRSPATPAVPSIHLFSTRGRGEERTWHRARRRNAA
jgi:hypothetical protein